MGGLLAVAQGGHLNWWRARKVSAGEDHGSRVEDEGRRHVDAVPTKLGEVTNFFVVSLREIPNVFTAE